MKSDQLTRWLQLLIRVIVASAGAFSAAQAVGGKGIATWLPAIVAGLSTLESGMSKSPTGPTEVLNVNPKSDPVETHAVKP